MTQPLLEKMANAGWIGLDYGVESFDLPQLRSLKRNPNLAQVHQAFRWTQEVGIFTTANIILWQPGDTIESFDVTLEALRWLLPDQVIALFFTPFPGTEGATSCSHLPTRTTRFEDYHLLTPILELDATVTNKELFELRQSMLSNYYHSPEYASLIGFRKRQFGDQFWPLTELRRDRLRAYGIDLWNLDDRPLVEPSFQNLPKLRVAAQVA
jgi:radical SAM superfamily enzyme YgiQ (UPF0313 family)